MNDLIELLNRKVIFHCIRRRGSEMGEKDFVVVHSLAKPLNTDRVPEWITPSLLLIYMQWHGLNLFQPGENVEEGFKLFNLDEVSTELNELRNIIDENRESYRENTNFKEIDQWLDGLVPIGEIMCSGNKFALDTFHRYESGECPIIYLNHEAYYGDVCEPDEMKIKATDTFDLLKRILNNGFRNLYLFHNQLKGRILVTPTLLILSLLPISSNLIEE